MKAGRAGGAAADLRTSGQLANFESVFEGVESALTQCGDRQFAYYVTDLTVIP